MRKARCAPRRLGYRTGAPTGIHAAARGGSSGAARKRCKIVQKMPKPCRQKGLGDITEGRPQPGDVGKGAANVSRARGSEVAYDRPAGECLEGVYEGKQVLFDASADVHDGT